MLTILLGTDWTANRDAVLSMLAEDVKNRQPGRILLVPELISHDTERRLCAVAGDTCSRYAEVLSFSRLAHRICQWCGCGLQECLDNGGRLVAMAAAARQLHSKLKAYAAIETRPEFLTALVEAVDEFKRCCISGEDLSSASKQADGAFAQKLEELSLLLLAYDSICTQGKRDPRDQLSWGLEQLVDSDFAQNHIFYIDGFPDFTQQNFSVITHLIAHSPDVIISMNCDSPDSAALAFEKPADTTAKLLRVAKQLGTTVQIKVIPPKSNPLHAVCQRLFQGNTRIPADITEKVHVFQADSINTECAVAVDRILQLIHSGARYRDVAVVCPDMNTYANTLQMLFEQCDIPAYIAGTESILEKSVIATVITALETALGGFESSDVLRYLKSALSPLDMEMCDRIENYAYIWNIQGKKWLQEWSRHPDGLTDVWKESDKQKLAELNQARRSFISPLEHLFCGFRTATKLSQQVDAIFGFLNEIQLDIRLQELSDQMNAAGDNRSAQILCQLWDILLSAMEQLRDTLADTVWDAEGFLRLFRLLLSRYDVGTIPPVLDTVMVGPVSAMRCHQAKHLFVLGAAEGTFPKYGGVAGVLTDSERDALRKIGVPLTGGASEGLQIEFSEIYGVFCGATETIYVSGPSGQTSFVFRRLQQMAGSEYIPSAVITAAAVHKMDAAALLIRSGAEDLASKLGLSQECSDIKRNTKFALGLIDTKHVKELYGAQLNLSASQIDTQAECRFSYFLKYGLRAKERKSADVDPAEFGTYVHAVLEDTAREVCQLGGFKKVSLERVLQIARKHSDDYTQKHFHQIDSKRISYLFYRNLQELLMVVEELWDELQHSAFEPVDFEVAFGDDAQLEAIVIPSNTMPAKLRGFVDRVDTWKELGQNYYRVVDYKTGKKDFDYCDVYNGIGLQMLLYLFALEQQGQALLGTHPAPAGVQYFPARVPIITADEELSDEEASVARKIHWKRKGLILNDEEVIRAMEDCDEPTRLNCKRKKDGTLTGDIATREQLQLLRKYVFQLLGIMVDDIASGSIEPNPYTRGSTHNACRFCPYGAVCHSASVEGRRNYRAISAERFWEDLKKEVPAHG